MRQFKTRKLQYLGHLIRHNTSQIQLLEGKIEGRRSRRRPRNTWTTDITTSNGMKYYQLKRAAEDRKRSQGLVRSQPRTRDDTAERKPIFESHNRIRTDCGKNILHMLSRHRLRVAGDQHCVHQCLASIPVSLTISKLDQ